MMKRMRMVRVRVKVKVKAWKDDDYLTETKYLWNMVVVVTARSNWSLESAAVENGEMWARGASLAIQKHRSTSSWPFVLAVSNSRRDNTSRFIALVTRWCWYVWHAHVITRCLNWSLICSLCSRLTWEWICISLSL